MVLTMRMSSHRYAKWALQTKREVRHSRELPWFGSRNGDGGGGGYFIFIFKEPVRINQSSQSLGGDKLRAGIKLLLACSFFFKIRIRYFCIFFFFALVLSICLLSSLFKALDRSWIKRFTAVPCLRSIFTRKILKRGFRGTVNDRVTHRCHKCFLPVPV